MPSQQNAHSLLQYLIERVSDIKALKVCLTLLSLIDDAKPVPIQEDELFSNSLLNNGLFLNKQSIRAGINAAITEQIIIKFTRIEESNSNTFYTANIEKWKESAINLGYLPSGIIPADTNQDTPKPIEDLQEQLNIYRLYEKHIGTITPSVSEELKEAETLYAPDWIKEAFHIAISGSKNNWRYINTILTRWNLEGKRDGKFRRNTEATDNNKYIDEYRRLRTRDS